MVFRNVRESRRLNQKPVFNFFQAFHAARIQKMPLNYMVTINFWQTAHAPGEEVRIFQKLRASYFTKWACRPRKETCKKLGLKYPHYGKCAHAWVFENTSADTDEINKVHVHWLVHLPKEMKDEFWSLLPSWLEKSGALPPSDDLDYRDIIDIKDVGTVYYCMKDANESFAEHYHIYYRSNLADDEGRIFGKRSGYSRSIGPAVVRNLRKNKMYYPKFKSRGGRSH